MMTAVDRPEGRALRTRAVLRAACVLAACWIAGSGVAQGQPASPRQPWAGPGEGIAPQASPTFDLGLSELQQERIQAIRDQQRAEREALSEKIAANRDALHALLESGTAEAGAVGELVLQGRRLEEQGRALRDAEQKAIREVLTPDQRRKLDRARTDRRGPGGRPGDWPAPPGGGRSRPGGGPGNQGPRSPFGPSGQQPLPW
jgi:Spy/CpxP family protein refolding chaperone